MRYYVFLLLLGLLHGCTSTPAKPYHSSVKKTPGDDITQYRLGASQQSSYKPTNYLFENGLYVYYTKDIPNPYQHYSPSILQGLAPSVGYGVFMIREGQSLKSAILGTPIAAQVTTLGSDMKLIFHPSNTKNLPPNACYVVANRRKTPVKIRDTPEAKQNPLHNYAFTNPNIPLQNQRAKIEDDIKQTKTDIESFQRAMDDAKGRLADNRAYQNNQCVVVKQRPIPPKPKVPAQTKVTPQANGACVNLLSSQFTIAEIYNGLGSYGMQNAIEDHVFFARLPRDKKLQCIQAHSDKWKTTGCRTIKWLGDVGKDWFNSCIKDRVQECISSVESSCMWPLTRWQANRRATIAEPSKLLNACKTDTRLIAHHTHKLQQLKGMLGQKQQKLANSPKPKSHIALNTKETLCL